MNRKSKFAIGIIAALLTIGSLMTWVGKNHHWNQHGCQHNQTQEQPHTDSN